LLTDFVCLYNYEFWLSLCKIVRSSVILLLPLFSRNLTPRAPKKYYRYVFDVIVTSPGALFQYLFSVFRGILPAIFRRFSKKLITSVVVHQTIFYQIIKINKTQLLLKRVDAGLHALSFSPGFNVCKLYLNKINTIIYRNKLFTDEFHYLKWIIKCTEIVYIYIMVSYIQSSACSPASTR
jgi:hypothetical protein